MAPLGNEAGKRRSKQGELLVRDSYSRMVPPMQGNRSIHLGRVQNTPSFWACYVQIPKHQPDGACIIERRQTWKKKRSGRKSESEKLSFRSYCTEYAS